LPLDEAERGFEIFKNKRDDCEKVVLKTLTATRIRPRRLELFR
jgi:hypothetical protein